MRGAPQRLRRIHRPAVANEGDDPALCGKRRADGRRHAAAEHAAAREEVAARFGRHEILDTAEGGRGIVGDDRVLGQRVERRQHGGVGAERPARAFRQNGRSRRLPDLAPAGASRLESAHDLFLVDKFREASGNRGERLADVAEERHVSGVFASERLRVVRDMEHGDPFGHRLGFAIRVGDEGASADEHDRLRRLEVSAHVGEIGLQHACPAGMMRRKRGA